MTSKSTNKPKEANVDKAASKRWVMTPARLAALKEGEAIRNIVCMDSIATRYFTPQLRSQIREICDHQMNLLGRESLTLHRDRIRGVLMSAEQMKSMSDKDWDKLVKYKKLKDL